MPLEVIQLLRQSSVPIIKALFEFPLTKTGHLHIGPDSSNYNGNLNMLPDDLAKANINLSKLDDCRNGLVSQTRAQQTVATYFRFSLMDLLHKLTNGAPHFVRCIKPNDFKLPMNFNRDKIVEQLAYTGIMETIKIRQMGFSHRLPFAEFLRRYSFLVFSFDERIVANRDNCRLLLVRLGMDGWALGKTKVFLKYYHIEYLSRLYSDQVDKIIRVQAYARRWLAIKRAEKERWHVARSVLIMQKYTRGWLARKKMSQVKQQSRVNDVTIHGQQAHYHYHQMPVAILSSSSNGNNKREEQGSSSPTSSQQQVKRRAIEQDSFYRERLQSKQSPEKAAILIQKCKPFFSHNQLARYLARGWARGWVGGWFEGFEGW